MFFEKSFGPPSSETFNAKACVDCHRMGGIGGAGASQFNARSIAIEYLQVPANASAAEISSFVGSLYRGLQDGRSTTFSTVAPLPHFGRNPNEQIQKANLMNQLDGRRSESGGPATHADLKAELASDIQHELVNIAGRFLLTAKTFHRNTPALYGVGLIDAVTDEQIQQQAQLQLLDPEVSGRPATLKDGGIGRFGWRANVATLEDFTRQACENELGLKVESTPLADQRQEIDISNEELYSLIIFMKSLPAPIPIRPVDSEALEVVFRGEQLFEETGCSVCHVQTMGLAENLYSDLLLHDMGEALLGPIAADPYITSTREIVGKPNMAARPIPGYHGAAVTFSGDSASTSSIEWERSKSTRLRGFKTLERPYQALPSRLQFVPVPPQKVGTGSFPGVSRVPDELPKALRKTIRITNVNQEWRTAPLWGLRDSAPYMHDGRAATIDEAIRIHDGESKRSRQRYEALEQNDRNALLSFLGTLGGPANVKQTGDL